MKQPHEAQFFALFAIAVGLAVSYIPPHENGAAIWMMVGAFLNRAMDGLFQPQASEVNDANKSPSSTLSRST